jgi:hypothetical protein
MALWIKISTGRRQFPRRQSTGVGEGWCDCNILIIMVFLELYRNGPYFIIIVIISFKNLNLRLVRRVCP